MRNVAFVTHGRPVRCRRAQIADDCRRYQTGALRNPRDFFEITHYLIATITVWGKSCVSLLLSFAGVVAGEADIIEDPLHGCFIGTGCTESTINGTNVTPTITNPLPAFTFTDSPGPITGDLLIETLIPDHTPGVALANLRDRRHSSRSYRYIDHYPRAIELRGQWSTGALAGFLG